MAEIKKIDIYNPYKVIWLILTNEITDSDAIKEYNNNLVKQLDKFEYVLLKNKYDLFADLLKIRGELNIKAK